MKILAIVYCYPPLLYPATMCYVKLLAGLKANGFDIAVVAIDPDSFYFPGGKSLDDTLQDLVPEGIREHRVWSWESHPVVTALRENRLTKHLLYKFFEPRKREWTFAARRYLQRLDTESYDVILTCSQPHCNHLLGLELKRKTGKPWIAYLSDPWTDNVYASFPSKKVFDYNLKLEQSVVTQADRLFFTSPEILELVMRKYPAALKKKCGVLPHCFIPEWYDGNADQAQPAESGKVRVVHTGHFYGPRTPMPLFRALARLQREDDLSGCVEFLLYGNMAPEHADFVRREGLEGLVSVRGTIPYRESLAAMNAADALLLVDAPLATMNESVFLPSKLVDYLGSGRPILGITPLVGASARVLRETGNQVCDIADEEAVCRAITALVQRQLPVPDAVANAAYNYRTVGKIMAEALLKLG